MASPDRSLATSAGVDVGGTFTDVVIAGPHPRAVKVPTTTPDQSDGVAAGVLAAADNAVDHIAHGTTTATNAVLERAVADTVLVVTQGFSDVLVIGRQNRPSLYDLSAVRAAPLVSCDHVVTVAERSAPDGSTVMALDSAEIARVVDAVVALQPESVAVCLLFSWACPDHEIALCDALAQRLTVPITRSSELLPELREFERASTCALNAAVAPVMQRYLSHLRDRLPGTAISVMTSGGGTATIDVVAAAPVHTLLSGPAAGVVAAAAAARAAGFADAVAFDMGGTSTDVCLIRNGRPQIATEAEIDGLPFRTPTVAIHTVGAGGGSIAWQDTGGALRVGPRSAGARPGPACYGHGGTAPTVTDAHCVLGHLDVERELGGGLRLDAAAATAAFQGLDASPAGVLAVVAATMVRALRRVSTEQGVDPAGLAVVAYGGAGPLHATTLARELGAAAVVVPPAPGVLSALGLLLAPPRHEVSRTVMTVAGDDQNAVFERVFAALEDSALRELPDARVTRVTDCRYAGQAHELRLNMPADGDLAGAFHAAHAAAYGYAMRSEPVVAVTVRVVAEGRPVLAEPPVDWDLGPARAPRRRKIGIGDELITVDVVDRAALRQDDVVTGPALIEQPDTTTLLRPGERAQTDAAGNLVITW